MNHDRDDDLRAGARAAGYAEALRDVRREIDRQPATGPELSYKRSIIARLNALENKVAT